MLRGVDNAAHHINQIAYFFWNTELNDEQSKPEKTWPSLISITAFSYFDILLQLVAKAFSD
jgi:hypothetical protein